MFAAICLGHVLRLLTRFDVVIAGWNLPFWVNVVGALLTGALSVWMGKLSSLNSADEKKA